jgi:hypothetical protein
MLPAGQTSSNFLFVAISEKCLAHHVEHATAKTHPESLSDFFTRSHVDPRQPVDGRQRDFRHELARALHEISIAS